jgi:hypothetical protein
MLTAVFRLCGHPSIGPTGVLDQSIALVRSPISPPPVRNDRSVMIVPKAVEMPANTGSARQGRYPADPSQKDPQHNAGASYSFPRYEEK